MKNRVLLKHLDSPVRILSFSLQDLMGYLIPFFIGALFDSMVVVPFSGLICLYLIRKALRRLPRFYVMRYLYWSLPTTKYNRMVGVDFPSSAKRFWVK